MYLQEETSDIINVLPDPDADMMCEMMGKSAIFKSFCASHQLEFSSVEMAYTATQAILKRIKACF